MILCDVMAAVLALFWLKPVAARTIQRAQPVLRARAAKA